MNFVAILMMAYCFFFAGGNLAKKNYPVGFFCLAAALLNTLILFHFYMR